MILSEQELERQFNQVKAQKKEENELSPSEIKEKLASYFRSQMLPFYTEAFKNLKKYNLFDSARNMGKTMNILYGILALALEENRNIKVLRKYATSNPESVHAEIKEKIENAFEFLNIDYDSNIIKMQSSKFIFFNNNSMERIIISLDGSYKSSTIKGKKGFSLVLLEETAEFVQNDFINAFPTFRDPKREVIFICLTNIPKEGQNHFIYHLFIKNPPENYTRFSPTWENNPAFFKSHKDWDKWLGENKPLFIGKEKSFKREILGEWTQSEFSFFKEIKVINENVISPNYWIYVNQSSQPYWLGIYRKIGGGFVVLKESFESPLEVKSKVVVVENKKEGLPIKNKVYWFKYVKPFNENETANYFLYNKLEINESCSYALNEAVASEWEAEEGGSLIERRLKKNTQGLFVYALRFAVAFCG